MTGGSSRAGEGLAGRRILIVEDEPLLADELFDELLERGAVPIGPAPSVEHALQAIATIPKLDAALLNVHLRGKTSFPIADDSMTRGVPFLFVAGNDAFVREHYPGIPSHPKPSDMPRLLNALDLLLSGQTKPSKS